MARSKKTTIDLSSDSLTAFGQMPKDAGQIVDIHYAVDWSAGILVCRTFDRSDRTTQYMVRELDEDADDADLEFEPQNGRLPHCSGPWIHATAV